MSLRRPRYDSPRYDIHCELFFVGNAILDKDNSLAGCYVTVGRKSIFVQFVQ